MVRLSDTQTGEMFHEIEVPVMAAFPVRCGNFMWIKEAWGWSPLGQGLNVAHSCRSGTATLDTAAAYARAAYA